MPKPKPPTPNDMQKPKSEEWSTIVHVQHAIGVLCLAEMKFEEFWCWWS